MKRIALIAAAFCIGMLGTTALDAAPYTQTTSSPILMIDGNGDGDTSVSVGAFGSSLWSYDYGYIDGGGNFVGIGLGHNFAGGEVVDFAIRHRVSGDIHALSDGSATVIYRGDIAAGNSSNPVVPYDYWGTAEIRWQVGSIDMVVTLSPSTGDGMAPLGGVAGLGAPIPEPGTLALIGLGAAGAGLLKRRRQRRA
ncbi:MAG: PEP-CTERM sorting domain-containing protein [Planctomycetota bacterium]